VPFTDLLQLYEVNLKSLDLKFENDQYLPMAEALESGRANYIIFEHLVRAITGLQVGTGCDHFDDAQQRYEQKAYSDPSFFPSSEDFFQVSPSSTFPANNYGPKIKQLLQDGNYQGALHICRTVENGYDSNDFYVLTNTANYRLKFPFRYFVISTVDLLKHLSPIDPRKVLKKSLLSVLKPKIIRLTRDQGVFKVL
jgi:hypothetical protein